MIIKSEQELYDYIDTHFCNEFFENPYHKGEQLASAEIIQEIEDGGLIDEEKI